MAIMTPGERKAANRPGVRYTPGMGNGTLPPTAPTAPAANCRDCDRRMMQRDMQPSGPGVNVWMCPTCYTAAQALLAELGR